MKAFVLAGGFGTRLRPLTLTRPKHLLPIANRPHIEHVFDLLLRYEIEKAVLLTSYLAAAFEDTRRSAEARGLRLHVTHESEPLGTAGAFKNAESFVEGEALLAFNGDILTNTDLDDLIEFHRSREAEATILLTPVDDPSAYGVVPTETDGRVRGFIEKPAPGTAPTNLINAGVYVLEPSVLDRIPAGVPWSAERQLFPQLVAEEARVYALGTDAYWMDIGTPEKYLQANLDALSGAYPNEATSRLGESRVLAADPDGVAPGAQVSSACLGEGVTVEDQALVERAVLLPGATVAAGAVVRSSILGQGARVAAGARLENQTVGDEAIVEAH